MLRAEFVSSWTDKQKLTTLQFTDTKGVLGAYPKVEKRFFDDLMGLCRNYQKYQIEMGLVHLYNQQNKELVADEWILLWAVDFRERPFQLLFQRSVLEEGKGVLGGANPPDFLDFLKETPNGLLATLSLINSPEKIKRLLLLVTRPKSMQESLKEKRDSRKYEAFASWIDQLKQTPNVDGQWFPSYSPRCPVCNASMTELGNYQVAFKQLACPRCGFEMKKGK